MFCVRDKKTLTIRFQMEFYLYWKVAKHNEQWDLNTINLANNMENMLSQNSASKKCWKIKWPYWEKNCAVLSVFFRDAQINGRWGLADLKKMD